MGYIHIVHSAPSPYSQSLLSIPEENLYRVRSHQVQHKQHTTDGIAISTEVDGARGVGRYHLLEKDNFTTPGGWCPKCPHRGKGTGDQVRGNGGHVGKIPLEATGI